MQIANPHVLIRIPVFPFSPELASDNYMDWVLGESTHYNQRLRLHIHIDYALPFLANNR